jgi:hypothetical protein
VPKSAANADGGILFTAVVARRKKDGKLVLIGQAKSGGQIVELHEFDDSSDRALELYDRLKKSKGENGRYTTATLFLRASALRKIKFT